MKPENVTISTLQRGMAGIVFCVSWLLLVSGQVKGEAPWPVEDDMSNYSCSRLFSPDSLNEQKIESDESCIILGNCNDLSRLAIDPFRGRTVVHAFGEWTQLDSDKAGLQSGFKTGMYGGGIGQDRLLGHNVIMGAFVEAGQLDINPGDNRYHGKRTSVAGLFHMSIFGNLWYTDLSLGIGRNTAKDTMTAPGIDYCNKYNGTQWNYELDAGLRIRQGYTRIEPFLGVHATTLNESSSANLFPSDSPVWIPAGNDFNSCRFILGSRIGWEYTGNLATVCPILVLSWLHEFGDQELFVSGETLPFPVLWRFGENTMGRDRLLINAGVTFALRDCVDLFFHYNSTIASDYKGYTIFGGLNKKF